MHEAVNVDEFDRCRGIVERFEAGAERDAGRVDERRSQSHATAQGAVALGEALRLGLQTAQPDRTLRVNRLGVILTENDPAVNNARTRRLVEEWRAASPNTEIFLHEFPAAERIPHDFIDPLQPEARTDKVNALLVEWLTNQM